jgi:predicted Ser/Thr protein kinase
MIGTEISQYRLVEKLGQGGMGTVYKAVDTLLDRVVAIKLVSADRADNSEMLQRFKSEARMQATLSHPNIATLYSYLIWEERAVMVMEFIEGETLQQMIARRGPIPADTAIPLFKQALLGVGAAHRRGIVHRDIKPANIMVSKDGVVKVMDFGIAKALGVTGTTRTNLQMGTVSYMAPEQVLSRPVDARTDIYSLGVSLYELLSGRVPFRTDSEYEVLTAHVQRQPELPTVHYPHIPATCVNAVMRALEKDPEKRHASTEDFSTALDHCEPDEQATSTSVAAPVEARPGPAKPAEWAPTVVSTTVLSEARPDARTVLEQAPPKRRSPAAPIVAAALVVLIAAVCAVFFLGRRGREGGEGTHAAGGGSTAAVQPVSGGSDEERRSQAEQEQAAQELQKQLADEQTAQSGAHGVARAAAVGAAAGANPGAGSSGGGSSGGGSIPRTQVSPAQPRSLAPSGRAAAERLRALTGTWSGTFTCGQGVTGATLQIVASSDENVGALFQFAVPGSSPGSYFLHGDFDPRTNRVAMRFTRWKSQPPSSSMAGNISGVVDLTRGEMHGNLVLPGCAGLSLRRQ